MNLTERCAAADEAMVGLIHRHAALKGQLTEKKDRLTVLADNKAHLVKCITVLDALIQTISKKGLGRIETVVTNGLHLVFGPEVSCLIEKNEGKRGTTYKVQIQVETPDGPIVDDPFESFGGGVVNVTAFLLRVLLLQRFKLAKLLVLDEAFNNVSEARLPAVSELLRSLTDDYGFDILAVTHQPTLAVQAHHAYQVSESGPISLHELGVGEVI